jgi:hypothetical protein
MSELKFEAVGIVMKPLVFALCVMLFGSGDLSAQTSSWQPSPGRTQVPIWQDSSSAFSPGAHKSSSRATVNSPFQQLGRSAPIRSCELMEDTDFEENYISSMRYQQVAMRKQCCAVN